MRKAERNQDSVVFTNQRCMRKTDITEFIISVCYFLIEVVDILNINYTFI